VGHLKRRAVWDLCPVLWVILRRRGKRPNRRPSCTALKRLLVWNRECITTRMPTTQAVASAAGAPRVESDFKVLQRLRQSCRTALERYVDVASHCSGQLARLTPGSVDRLGRMNLMLLQKKESKAHQAYLDARTALLEFVLEEGDLDATRAPAVEY
jgi:hypothetical protein